MIKRTITDKIDNITRIPDEYMTPTPPAPKSVKIELSGRCNLRCGFCALQTREKQPTAKDDMDLNFFKRITAEMIEAGVEEIGLFYIGEPFMNPDLLVQACEYCKWDLGVPYVFVTSNGVKAEPRYVEDMMKAGLDSLKWSVNAADAEQYEKISGVKAKNMERMLDNIKKAWGIRNRGNYNTGLFASSIKYDGEQEEKMEALLDMHIRPFVDEHYYLPLYSMGSQATKREEELGYRPIAGNQGRADNLVAPLPCWSAFTEGHVRADGHFSVCCFGSDERFDAGDLNTHSFMEVWHSDLFKEIRGAHLRGMGEGMDALKGTMCERCIAYS